jgi:aryl-alcohol dehydrogenase-like predicted oxidoreductase
MTELHRLSPISSVQARYNLLSRELERDLGPLCLEEGIAILAFNPLAGGLLTGKHDRTAEPADGTRFGPSAGPFGAVYRSRYWQPDQFDSVDALQALAARAGLALTTLASAWVTSQPAVTSVIVGASRPEQVLDWSASLKVQIPTDVIGDVLSASDVWRNAA